MTKPYKPYLIWVNNGTYEGWAIAAQADTVDEAETKYMETLRYTYGSEVLITRHLPVKVTIEDGGENE